KVVLEEGSRGAGPILRRSAPIFVKGTPVGRVEAEIGIAQFYTQVGWVTLLSLLLGSGGYFAFRVFPLRALDRAMAQLQTQNERFDAALNNMSQGVCMFDREQRLIVCNDRYLELYGLKREQLTPATTLHDLLAHRFTQGAYPVEQTSDDFQAQVAAATRSKVAWTKVVELADGRAIIIKYQPLPSGGWVTTHEDVTEQRRIEARIAHMAHHDALTNLANRVLLRERLEEALQRDPSVHKVAVLCMDLDRFKEINDTLGHSIGDSLLKAVALRLRGCVREGDIVARLGGDEFAVLQVGAAQPAAATALARRVVEAIGMPFELEGHQVVLGTSVGIAVSPGDGSEPDRLLRSGDLALYRAKSDGRGTYRFFAPGMDAAAQARRKLEIDLRNALSAGQFELYYQPLVDLDRNEVSAFEALLRWKHPERGTVPPDEFIPLAEETGLIVPIGEWVLRQACSAAASWPEAVRVAVNLSALQLNVVNIAELVSGALTAARLPASRLELEITESALMENTEPVFATLRKLHDMGVRISLDDFGIGYSCLSYLRQFRFDKIKIDRSFIQAMGTDLHSVAIIQAVIGLAANLEMATVGEGVETREQLDCLRAFGCTEVQGFYISIPRPGAEVAAMLSAIPSRTALAA